MSNQSVYKVYHNPAFGAYVGNHDEVIIPHRPAAYVTVPGRVGDGVNALHFVYGITQHGPEGESWFNRPAVMAGLRSTSIGDVIETPTGERFVVGRGTSFEALQRPFAQLAPDYQTNGACEICRSEAITTWTGTRSATLAPAPTFSVAAVPTQNCSTAYNRPWTTLPPARPSWPPSKARWRTPTP